MTEGSQCGHSSLNIVGDNYIDLKQGCSKLFTTGQARINPECYTIKCVGQTKTYNAYITFLSLAVLRKPIKPTIYLRILFIT